MQQKAQSWEENLITMYFFRNYFYITAIVLLNNVELVCLNIKVKLS